MHGLLQGKSGEKRYSAGLKPLAWGVLEVVLEERFLVKVAGA
jgi:hypothetical protein